MVEMLDAVSTVLHPSVNVSKLTEKYGVSERCFESFQIDVAIEEIEGKLQFKGVRRGWMRFLGVWNC